MSTFSAARRLARSLMPELIQKYDTGSRVLTFLRATGKGYKTQDFWRDWREFTGIYNVKDVISHIPEGRRLTRLHTVYTQMTLQDRYMLVGKVLRRNNRTGKITIEYTSLYRHVLPRSVSEAINFLKELVKERYPEWFRDEEVEDVQLDYILRRDE